MAVVSHPAEYTAPVVEVGPRTATTLFYIVIGVVAAAGAITAALATSDVGLFEECYSSCVAAVQ